MAGDKVILVGTVGQGVMRSADSGESWMRVGINQGLHSDALVRTLASHPTQPERLFAGTDKGLYASSDAGQSWKLSGFPPQRSTLSGPWHLTLQTRIPCSPAPERRRPRQCSVPGTPVRVGSAVPWKPRMNARRSERLRVTGIAVDPSDGRNVWLGLEVDGVRRSTDGGDTWMSLNGDIPNLDIHNVTVAAGPPKTVVVVVNNDVYTQHRRRRVLDPPGN